MRENWLRFVFAAGFLCLSITAAEAKEVRIKWGSTSVRSVGYAIEVQFAKAVNKAYPGQISVTVVETGGAVENLNRMRLRLLHVAQSNPAAAYTAYNGMLDFKDQKHPNIRMLFVTCIAPFTFVAARDTGVTSIEGLNGIKMASNPLTSSERLGRMFLEANGIKPNYKWGGTSTNLEAMKAKTADAWAGPGFRDGGITEVALARPLNFLQITDAHVKRYNEKFPGHGKGMLSPANQYPGQDKAYFTMGFVQGLMADKDLSAEVIHKIMKAIWDKRMEMAKVDASLREGGFSDFPKMTMEHNDVPLHPGAIQFYRERGVKVPEKLFPPEMK